MAGKTKGKIIMQHRERDEIRVLFLSDYCLMAIMKWNKYSNQVFNLFLKYSNQLENLFTINMNWFRHSHFLRNF